MQLSVLFTCLFLALTALAAPEHEKREPTFRMSRRDRIQSDCPAEHTVCGVSSSWSRNAWECIDTAKDLESCGGCVFPLPGNHVTGQDCTNIEGVEDVACMDGACRVYTCRYGYTVSEDGRSCAAAAAADRGGHHHAADINKY